MAAESLCQTVAVFGAGLLENVVRVRLDRPLRNAKLRADFPVVLSLKQQREHVLLSGAQRNAGHIRRRCPARQAVERRSVPGVPLSEGALGRRSVWRAARREPAGDLR